MGELKCKQEDVELVQEYCKSWVYLECNLAEYVPLHLIGQQSHLESILYGKVDYIITDSAFIQHEESQGVIYYNFLLKPSKYYKNSGRYENLEEAKTINDLNKCDYYYVEVNCPETCRHNEILKNLKL